MDTKYEVILPRDKVNEGSVTGSMVTLNDGRIMLMHGQLNRRAYVNYSEDGGRSWSGRCKINLEVDSEKGDNLRPGLIRLASGKLGLVRTRKSWGDWNASLNQSLAAFHTSHDEGRTWSEGVYINTSESREKNSYDSLIQLSTGRLIVPFNNVEGAVYETKNPKECSRFGETFYTAYSWAMQFSYVYYSDDEGHTWTRSRNEVHAAIDRGMGGSFEMGEPAVVELSDGRLLMMAHTDLGRLYRSYSEDGGETWREAEPTELVLKRGPISLKNIPESGDVLVIWNQISAWESLSGLYRHRLSCAVSSDGGSTWKNHKNIESLDDVNRLDPEPIRFYRVTGNNRQPLDRVRYHRAPGPLRLDQPACTFCDGHAVIFYGHGVLGEKRVITGTYGMDYGKVCRKYGFEPNPEKSNSVLGNNKIKVVPVEWFTD